MAQTNELDLEVKGGGTSKKTLIILVSIIVALVAVIATGAVLFLTGALTPKAVTGEVAADTAEVAKAPQQPALYHSLDPAFVVNFYHQSQRRVRFLQVKMEAMARDPEIIEAIQTHTPAIRNSLLLLLSQQEYEAILTIEGKEQLREAAREKISQVLEAQAGIPGVEAVYFTSFIMQ